jgi:hypothetical protein
MEIIFIAFLVDKKHMIARNIVDGIIRGDDLFVPGKSFRPLALDLFDREILDVSDEKIRRQG